MNSMTKRELFEKIDRMTIYEEDYPIIKEILKTNDPQFISTVVEEVIKGNLYWVDFKNVLPTEYRTVIRETLNTQNKLAEKIESILKFNEETRELEDVNRIKKLVREHIGIVPNTEDETWSTLSTEVRNNILYLLTTYNTNDTVLTRRAKTKLLNAIENGKIAISNSRNIDKEQLNNPNVMILDPNALLLSNDKLIVPVSFDSIVLTKEDEGFMKQNGISIDEMKKLKASYNYIASIVEGDNNA